MSVRKINFSFVFIQSFINQISFCLKNGLDGAINDVSDLWWCKVHTCFKYSFCTKSWSPLAWKFRWDNLTFLMFWAICEFCANHVRLTDVLIRATLRKQNATLLILKLILRLGLFALSERLVFVSTLLTHWQSFAHWGDLLSYFVV